MIGRASQFLPKYQISVFDTIIQCGANNMSGKWTFFIWNFFWENVKVFAYKRFRVENFIVIKHKLRTCLDNVNFSNFVVLKNIWSM